MNNYQSISTIARNLKASENDLLDLEKRKMDSQRSQEWQRVSVWAGCIQGTFHSPPTPPPPD